ncbi:subtilase-type protease inhibitor [Streptomyces jumonjinensis]|uniref:Probable subtilase-type protease inhibitor n=1 Tax=Streptomyces jumonjinensis TaxID=1945 RepID=A0A646KME8_STRJU|nr:subtilase-type protease inhibitor [Streptomyces jumonjinensis]MQT03413.1 serine protease [Streptomyces jumonjinensis]
MRSVRSTIAVAAALALSGTAAGAAQAVPPQSVPPQARTAQPAAVALAQPAAGPLAAPAARAAGLYAPSALVLTIGKGESPKESAVQRAVTLGCAPAATGTHPSPAAACRELRSVEGDFAELPSALPQTSCTREWDPVTVTADGVWRGQRVEWFGTYNNGCEMWASLGGGVLFSF